MAKFDKVSPGTPKGQSPAFKSAWCNSVSEATAYFQERIAAGEAGGEGRNLKSSSGLVNVKNMTEGDLLRGHYVQLGDYLYDYHTDAEPLAKVKHHKLGFEGNLYDPANKGRIAIYITAVKGDPDAKTAKARIIGVCTAVVNVTDITHRFATPVDGESVLDSATSGRVEILSDITETGEQEVAVLLGGGGGDTKRTALLKATDTIPGRVGDVPGEGTDFDVVDGDEPEGAIKNWSTVAILADAYMITVQIGDFDVIVNAFC